MARCTDLIRSGEKTDDKGDDSERPVASGNHHQHFGSRQALISVLNTVHREKEITIIITIITIIIMKNFGSHQGLVSVLNTVHREKEITIIKIQ